MTAADLIRAKLADGRTLADGEVLDLLRDYDALVARTSWRLIESAPADGTVVVLWSPDAADCGVILGYCNSSKDLWFEMGSYTRIDVDSTHWMPLPEPPGGGA